MNILNWLLGYWQRYQESRKRQELHARLARNAEGKFSQKKYLKAINQQVKSRRTVEREKQQDGRD